MIPSEKYDLNWPDSLWKQTAEELPGQPCLLNKIDTDLLIIGAGYTGLSCGLHASEDISDVVIIDQVQPGWGCSGRNGGQVNPQWKPSLNDLRQMYSPGELSQFIDTLDQTGRLVFDLIERYQIDCQALTTGCVVATKGNKGGQYVREWSRFWQDYGADVEMLDAAATQKLTGTNCYDYAMLDYRGGSLQPLSFTRGLARACVERGVRIFGDTQADSIVAKDDGWLVTANGQEIKCRRLVIGTNGYTDKLWPGLAESIVPVASMLTATEPLSDTMLEGILPGRHPVAEYAGVPAYYRIDESNRLVFGWRGTVSGRVGSLDTRHLRKRAVKLFPQIASAKWDFDWSGYVGITSHQRPMLVELGENAYAGLGYNGRGITMATMMGKQLAMVMNSETTAIPVTELEKIPFHPFYPIGVTSRIVSGHVRDYFV